jgi:hypothetical protein
MGVTAADFDNDGWDDIYVANDRTENFLFHNKHDGTFEEIGSDTGRRSGRMASRLLRWGRCLRILKGAACWICG